MIGIIATFTVLEENAAAFEAAAGQLAEATRAGEPGAKLYQLVKSLADPIQYCMMELWEDQAALDNHVTTEWYKAAGPVVAPLLAGRPKLERYSTVG